MNRNGWLIRGAIALAIALFALTPSLAPSRPAEAATLTVTKAADTNDGTCDADCSLREAINAANGGDTVSLPAGTYTLSIAGATENAGATGDLDINVNLTIEGAGSATTIIDANDIDRVLDVAAATNLTLRGVTVRDGDAPGFEEGGGVRGGSGTLTIEDSAVDSNTTSGANGGGIVVTGALVIDSSTVSANAGYQGGGIVADNIQMSNTTVEWNTATNQGGGIWECCTDATFDIEDSTIDNNESGDQGGGIFHCCGALQLTLTNSSVSSNHSTDGGGGIFYCCTDDTLDTLIHIGGSLIADNTAGGEGGGISSCCADDGAGSIDLLITNTVISGNTSLGPGGGLYDCCGAGTTTIDGSVIAENQAGSSESGGAEGGGIYSDADDLAISASTIRGNTVYGDGGGVYIESEDATIDASAITDNRAEAVNVSDDGGGGIYNDGVLSLTNSTVSGNSTNGDGGGIYNSYNLAIRYATIADNSAEGYGDQILNRQLTEFANTIIAGSADNCSGGEESSPGVTSLGNNIDSHESCELGSLGDSDNTDPLLGDLGDNGGSTWTHALLAGSPAIDEADSELCPEQDQRGVARPVGPECDIGAFEGESEGEPSTSTPTATATATSTPVEDGGGGGDITAPRSGATTVPQPTAEPPSPAEPEEPPAPGPTAPGGGVAPEGVGAPNTGSGPGGRGSQLAMVVLALAALSGLVTAAGIATASRRRQR